MELCVAMKYCITLYSSNEAGVLKKFARWLFHAKNINGFGVKPRAPMALWDPKSVGCSFVPSGVFHRPPCRENLCSVAGVEQCPHRECVFPVLQSAEETQLGCASSCPGSSTAVDRVGGGAAAITAAKTCALFSQLCLQGRSLQWWVMGM